MRKVERLVSGANRPAPEAFAELVRSNSKLIYKMSLRILKNHSDAEDDRQEVYSRWVFDSEARRAKH